MSNDLSCLATFAHGVVATAGRAALLVRATKEAQYTTYFARYLAEQLNPGVIGISRPSQAFLSDLRDRGVSFRSQFVDEAGEHDISLFANTDDTPDVIFEVKFVKRAGDEQTQTVQPFCRFLNDILAMCISRSLLLQQGRVATCGAIAFVQAQMYEHRRRQRITPWAQWFTPSALNEPAFQVDSFVISPSLAQPNAGRTGADWPDFRNPSALQRRHTGMVLTGGTNSKLLGLFRREPHSLSVGFRKATHVVECDGQKVYVAICVADSVVLRTSQGDISDINAILKWMP